MSSPHKPRRKPKRASTPSSLGPDHQQQRQQQQQHLSRVSSGPDTAGSSSPSTPDFPLVAFLSPAKTSTSQWVILPLVLMAVGLFRWAVGFWGYSGFQKPPMRGDYEAQRHWMEITTHLPVSQWYFYDLQYWGLDYPPLTAYHSWILGKIGSSINPRWFALDASRGIEEEGLKIYMRATVLTSEYLIYVPAVVIFNRRLAQLAAVSVWESSIALVAILMQPGTLLIDHGHFQYNTVMLGLALASVSSMLAGRLLWSCVFFVAALCFKQMALYYSLAVFAYLLGVCFNPKIRLLRFLAIAVITVLSFAVAFAPLLVGAEYEHYLQPKVISGFQPPYLYSLVQSLIPIPIGENSYLYPIVLQLTQAVHRIFPLARGLFEDKVANLWCAIHTVYKLNRFSLEFLSRLSLLATLAAATPSCAVLFLWPRKTVLPYALSSCAWAFFLCSFQVHEKSVLLPLLPMTVLLGGRAGLRPEIRAWVGWANVLGCWTMFPLLKRDELRIPYAVITLLWAYLLGLPPTSLALYTGPSSLLLPTKILHLGSYAAMVLWHVLEAFVPPPANKPDLWVVLNCVLGAGAFGVCYLWCTWNAILGSGLVGKSAEPASATRRKINSESKTQSNATVVSKKARGKSP